MTQTPTNQHQNAAGLPLGGFASSERVAGLMPASAAPAGSATRSQVSRSELERLTRESYVLRVLWNDDVAKAAY